MEKKKRGVEKAQKNKKRKIMNRKREGKEGGGRGRGRRKWMVKVKKEKVASLRNFSINKRIIYIFL